jgi:hypothetical protein
MPFFAKVLSFWRNLIHRQRVEQDLNDELEAYVDELVERRIHAGASSEAAREAALIEFGEAEKIRDLVRQERIGLHSLRIGAILAAIVLAFIAGAWFGRWVFTPDPVVLEGRVFDEDGQPARHVKVGLKPSPSLRRFTYTDETGHFRFLNPPSLGFVLSANQNEWGVWSYSLDQFSKRDEFMLSAPTSISVVSKGGQPLDGVPLGLAKGPQTPDLRSFRYSQSVLELQTSKTQ